MRRAALVGLLSVLAATPAAITPCADPVPLPASRQLRLVSTVWPPFTDVAGRPRRASELVHAALERAGIAAETSIVADDRLIPSLSEGSYDGSGALWYSAERERFLIYSKPYMETRLVLIGRKGSDVSADSLSDLAGKRVALVETWAYGPAVDEATATVFVGGASMEDNLRAVLEGTVDYTIIDDLVIRYLVDQYRQDVRDRLEIGTRALVVRPLHVGVRRDVPGAEEIVKRFDEQIPRMLADGSYNRILRLTWIQADVDGDGQSELVLDGKHAGEAPPSDAYVIVSQAQNEAKAPSKKLRFLIGGDLYKDWESVPEHYKVPLPSDPLDPAGQAEPLFKIKW
jgi:polar amino acid transport system substrate-binding protein